MATSEKLKELGMNFVFIIYFLMILAYFGYVD
jgi:Na+-transporting methylmalonyl-CoA/oxaloacetate decarboxylase gamma subunit